MLAVAPPTPAGDRLAPLSRGLPPTPYAPQPLAGLQGSGRQGGAVARQRAAPCADAPTFLPKSGGAPRGPSERERRRSNADAIFSFLLIPLTFLRDFFFLP